MKSLIIRISLIAVMITTVNVKMSGQTYTDPFTGAQVTLQTKILGDELEKSRKAQTATASTNTAITAVVNDIREYDRKMLDYLKKANSVFDGIFHAADAIDMGVNIVRNLGNCAKAAVNHPSGAIVSAIVSKRHTKVLQEIASLTANITKFVKGNGEGNLLNSAERLQILYDVHMQMRRLDREVTNLYWEILSLEWSDLGRYLSSDLFYSIYNDNRLYKEAQRRVDRMFAGWN